MKQPDGSQQAGGAASASVHSGPVAGQHYATLPASLQPPQLLHHAYPVAQQHVAHVQPPPALHAQPLTATGETGPDAPTRNSMEIPVGSVLGIPVKLHVLLPAITVLYTVNAWLMSTAAAVFMFLLTGPVLYGARARLARRAGATHRTTNRPHVSASPWLRAPHGAPRLNTARPPLAPLLTLTTAGARAVTARRRECVHP